LLNASELAVLLVVLWLVSCRAFTSPTDQLSKVLMSYFFIFILI